ncbi:MAG: PPC domain-containing DNA-binding protein [Candidatus Asgardarchaeia archaeon]
MKVLEDRVIGRVTIARLERGEDILDSLSELSREKDIHSAFFTLIGALSQARFGYFEGGIYKTIEVKENVEIVSCMGNVTKKGSESFIHAHIAVACEDGSVYGGHLMKGCIVDPTAEVFIVKVRPSVIRKVDPYSNLYLIDK